MADLERVAVRVSDGLRLTLSKMNTPRHRHRRRITKKHRHRHLRHRPVGVRAKPRVDRHRRRHLFPRPPPPRLLAWHHVRWTGNWRPSWSARGGRGCRSEAARPTRWSTTTRASRLIDNSKSFNRLNLDLKAHRTELPALYMGVHAICSVPGLVAIALLGTLGVGFLGTVLLDQTGLVD